MTTTLISPEAPATVNNTTITDKTAAAVPFHRINTVSENHRWWKPIALVALSVGIYAAMVALLTYGTYLLSLDALRPGSMHASPQGLAYNLLVWGCAIPAVLLARRILRFNPGQAISTTGRFRTRLFLVSLGLGTLLYASIFLTELLIDLVQGYQLELNIVSNLGWFMLVCIAFLPLQCAGEEFAFRSLIPQALGSWIKNPVIPFFVTTALFAIGHGYPSLATVVLFIQAAAFAYIVWRTNGIEWSIGLHLANNLIAFTTGYLGLSDGDFSEGDITWIGFAIHVGTSIFFALVIPAIHKRIESTQTQTLAVEN
ncbi:MAG: CPBP family intramembrane metalloprotease [Propionibacteriaceae bacterium]|nr:CPBP family intramembrane metalloprotease [Propionibacteriaceae bacterium]